MKRSKHSLGLLAVILCSIALIAGCGEQATKPAAETKAETKPQATYAWKLAMTWPTGAPIFSDAVNRFAEAVNTMSQGQMTIEIDSANKHKAPFGVLDMVKAGQYEMGHSASYYWKGVDPGTMFFTTMPFGMTAPEQYAWFYYGGGLELMQKTYAKHGVYSFPGGNTGVQMGGWFRKEIKGLKDLDGLKMRVPGFAGEVLAKVGVAVTNIPPGELYTALERGTIDALEWVGPSLDLNMGFHKIAPYYYTGWHEPAAELQFLINKQAFDQLPKHLQEILTTSIQAIALDTTAHFNHASSENLSKLQGEFPDVKVRTLPTDVLKALEQANQKLLAEAAEASPAFKEILDSQQTYLAKARNWSMISDYAYMKSTGGN